eukprot:TRINITY_DN35531_c0_g1_i1.p1 TRINITY_DN35531_c0_g1~~TRINITY_DN35531_c0_g1_i1.p1  ORF type:complete len:687 (-),score=122.63 TRINITY_DN35531_c0_g1_i1:44-2104(-)
MACWFLQACCVEEGDDGAVVLESAAETQSGPGQVEGSVPAELGRSVTPPSPVVKHARSITVLSIQADTASTRDAGSADIASVHPCGPSSPSSSALASPTGESICDRSEFGGSVASSEHTEERSEGSWIPQAVADDAGQKSGEDSGSPTMSRSFEEKKALMRRSMSRNMGTDSRFKKGKSFQFLGDAEDPTEIKTSALGINIENPGKVRDFYSIGKELGKGNFGSVLKAKLRSTEALRAIKKIQIPKGEHQSTAKLSGFLKHEIQIHKMLDHPNIVKLYEIFEDEKHIYMVLEICRDGDLIGLIKEGNVTEPDGAVIMIQVLRAVAYMHMQDVCHRDLKAENMLLNMQTNSKQSKKKDAKQSRYLNAIRVTDFGLACTIEEDQQLTLSCGTITHKSPQILQHAYTNQCDLWACGVIMYHMLGGGVFPFTGDNEQIKQKILTGKYVWTDLFLTRSAESMALIRSFLEYQEDARVTARSALKHDWFQKQLPKRERKELDARVLQRLRGFRKLSKFRRVALSAIVSMLPDDSVMKGRELFTSLDGNGDGFVAVSELRESMERLKLQHNAEVLVQDLKADEKKATSKILKEFRRRGSFKDDVKLPPFTYTEFLAATFDRAKDTTEAVCKNAFQLFDKDGSGKLDANELFDGRLLGELTPEEADEVIKDIDTDNDFQISFPEFLSLMTAAEK